MEKSIYTPYSQVLSKKLKEMREAAGLTQRELATKWRTEQAIIVRLEHGQRRLDMIEFYLLCKLLKLDPTAMATEVFKGWRTIDSMRKKERGKM